MENQNTQNIAEKIARLLQAETQNADFHLLQSSLDKITQRLDNIETKLAFQTPKSNHSSQERFFSLEELADEIINGLQNEKACPFEPAGKPCDNCAMCNSRGF